MDDTAAEYQSTLDTPRVMLSKCYYDYEAHDKELLLLADEDEDFKWMLHLLAQDEEESQSQPSLCHHDGAVADHVKKGRKQGCILRHVVQVIYDHLLNHGKYNIHQDRHTVFWRLKKIPDKRRIYEAVRWLESFDLARRGCVDKSNVFIVFEDRSTMK